MRFNTTVEGARWDEDARVWQVALAGGDDADRAVPDHRDRLPVPAAGARHPGHRRTSPARSSTPPTGTTTIDPTAAAIAVIGTGATAVQLIPELAKKAADLTVYQRTPIWVVPKIDFRFGERAKRLFARVPLTQRAMRWRHRLDLRVHDRRRGPAPPAASAGSTSPRPTCRRCTGSRRSATRNCAASSPRTTTSAASGRRSPTATTAPSPSRTCTCRPTASTASRPTASSQRRRHQDRHRHPGAGHRLRPVGGQLPGHRGHRPRGPQPRKVVARDQVPGLPGRVDAVLPELPEPGQPVRVPRVELLQHDGIPDAAHGPAVRRAASAAVPPPSRSPRKPTPASWTG